MLLSTASTSSCRQEKSHCARGHLIIFHDIPRPAGRIEVLHQSVKVFDDYSELLKYEQEYSRRSSQLKIRRE
jgi:hypothetical protein